MSKRWPILVAVAVLLPAAIVGGGFYYRTNAETEAVAKAEAFLVKAGGPDRKAAFALTEGGTTGTLDLVKFEGALDRLGMSGVTSPRCDAVDRESNFLNTFTVSLKFVPCTWAGGRVRFAVVPEGVSAAYVDGRASENFY